MKARKNRAFFVETLIITFLLLLMLTILVRIFGAAAAKSQSAERMTTASIISQNAITMFEASEGEFGKIQQKLITESDEAEDFETVPQETFTLTFNDKGEEDPQGDYEVTTLVTCEVRAVGYMLTGNMSVVNKNDPENSLAQLDTAKYFPDSADIVLSADDVLSFDDFAVAETESETESDAGVETESEAPSQKSTEGEVAE